MPTQKPDLPAPSPLDAVDPTNASEAVRRRIRARWEKRREETSTPPTLHLGGTRPIDVDDEHDPSKRTSRYFSATYRSWWPRPAGDHSPGFVPFSLRNLTVRRP